MPYLKFSRDKRGYENFFLIEPPSGDRDAPGKGRARVLFWFRTPPNVKVGRAPFSDDVRAMVEAQNPDLKFDWARITSTPIPSQDADHWRERRRAEKAARKAAREEEALEEGAGSTEAANDDEIHEPVADREPSSTAAEPVTSSSDPVTVAMPTTTSERASEVQAGDLPERRRRRRRRRGRRPPAPAGATAQAPVDATPETQPVQEDAVSDDEPASSDEV